MRDEQRFVAPAQFGSIGPICEFVVRAAKSVGFDERALSHIELAVDEACTNIIEHACKGQGEGDIHLTCGLDRLEGNDYFVVRLRDQGEPFHPDSVPVPEFPAESTKVKVGGLGVYFMRQIMDRVEFSFLDGWNQVVMLKKLRPKDS